ncbi:uncharacterized protein DS421_8g250560 [Arachis hypogaea]|nr:uncharacterized protein DS421_8g250560 [Arachis hypogaea]
MEFTEFERTVTALDTLQRYRAGTWQVFKLLNLPAGHSNSERFSSSPSFVSRRRRHSPFPSRELTVAAQNRRLARSPSLLPIVASLLGSSSVEEGACGYDDDDEQQWPNETEMVAEVRQRISNMAGVRKRKFELWHLLIEFVL